MEQLDGITHLKGTDMEKKPSVLKMIFAVIGFMYVCKIILVGLN